MICGTQRETKLGGVHTVYIGGVMLQLAPSLKVRNHSPTGFSWGYGGSGPAQLALAILLYYTKDKEFALEHYQVFKNVFVAKWRTPTFQQRERPVKKWIREQMAKVPATV